MQHNTIVLKIGESALGRSSHVASALPKIKNLIQTYQRQGVAVIVVLSALRGHSRKIRSMVRQSDAPGEDFSQDLFYFGEFFSCSLLEHYLNAHAIQSRALCFEHTPLHLNMTQSTYHLDTIDLRLIQHCQDKHIVPIIPGFIGLYNTQYKSLEFDGSDIAAVELAIQMQAERCVFIKKPGQLHTMNPKLSVHAQAIPHLSYEQLMMISALGTPIIHHQALRRAQENHVSLSIQSYEPHRQTFIDHKDLKKPVLGLFNQSISSDHHQLFVVTGHQRYHDRVKKLIETTTLHSVAQNGNVMCLDQLSEHTLKLFMQKLQHIFSQHELL